MINALQGATTIKRYRIKIEKLLIFGLLTYLPFYLPLRFMLSENVMYVQDSIVLLLTLGFLLKKMCKWQSRYRISRMDLFFFLFLFYSLMLLSLSLLKGGILLSVQHFHNFIPGILMYFLVREYIEVSDSHILLQIYLITSMVVATVYIYEWISMNILGKGALSWAVALFEGYGVGGQFLTKGSLGFFRPMGLIGYSHATGIFVGGGIIILASRAIYYNKKTVNYILIGIAAIAVALTASRIAIIGVFLSILFILWNSKVNISSFAKRNIIPILVSTTIVGGMLFQYLGNFPETVVLVDFLSNSLSGSEHNKSIFEVFVISFKEDISGLNKIFESYPLALLAGAGYPNYSETNVLNPIITNHNYFLMWTTMYGVFGCTVASLLAFFWRKRIVRNLKNPLLSLQDRCALLSIYGIVFLFLFSTIHSSSIKFYPLYFWFFTLIGLVGNFPGMGSNKSYHIERRRAVERLPEAYMKASHSL